MDDLICEVCRGTDFNFNDDGSYECRECGNIAHVFLNIL